jgi:hypothetical protein
VAGDHLLNQGVLDTVGRLETLNVVGEDGGEAFGALAFEEQETGQEAVTEPVLRRAAPAFRGPGAEGESSVGAGC